MTEVQQRTYQVDDQTSLVFTDVIRDKRRGNVGPALSIITDKAAHVRKLGPEFGAALEAVIKRLTGKR